MTLAIGKSTSEIRPGAHEAATEFLRTLDAIHAEFPAGGEIKAITRCPSAHPGGRTSMAIACEKGFVLHNVSSPAHELKPHEVLHEVEQAGRIYDVGYYFGAWKPKAMIAGSLPPLRTTIEGPAGHLLSISWTPQRGGGMVGEVVHSAKSAAAREVAGRLRAAGLNIRGLERS